MRRLVAVLVGLLVVFASMASPALPVHGQAGGVTRSFAPGWNLIAVPPGTGLGQVTLAVTLQPGDTEYETLSPREGSQTGFGYWAFFQNRETATLAAGSDDPYFIDAPAGQYILVGDPSGSRAATVSGADLVYTYDPASGYQSTATLQPGQGAWVLSSFGNTISVTPSAARAPAPPPPPPPAPVVTRLTAQPPTVAAVIAVVASIPGPPGSGLPNQVEDRNDRLPLYATVDVPQGRELDFLQGTVTADLTYIKSVLVALHAAFPSTSPIYFGIWIHLRTNTLPAGVPLEFVDVCPSRISAIWCSYFPTLFGRFRSGVYEWQPISSYDEDTWVPF